MRIRPLVQTTLIDVANWEVDAEFGVFPQGARAKDAVFAPVQPVQTVLVGGKRYLFKRSKRSYPDQVWGEVMAYRLACLMGLDAPPAFAAINSQTGYCAALIEWFYWDSASLYVHGGEFMQRLRPGFDRLKGEQHNLQDVEVVMRNLAQARALHGNWRMWWAKALLFDALIGNTDRHQDNWGLLFSREVQDPSGEGGTVWLAPLFDNGTSLGHERFADRVASWTDQQVGQYIQRGCHHIKWKLTETPALQQHMGLLQQVLATWPDLDRVDLRECLDFGPEDMEATIKDLANLPLPIPLSPERIRFVLRLLTHRWGLLKELLNDSATPPR